MRPARLSYKIFSWLCVCTPTNESIWIKIGNISFTVAMMFMFNVTIISCVLYFNEISNKNLELTLYSIMNMMTSMVQFYTCIAIIILRKDIEEIFFSYERFCRKSKYSCFLGDFKESINFSLH